MTGQAEERAIREAMLRCGVPLRFADCSWDNWKIPPSAKPITHRKLSALQEWSGKPPKEFATIAGPPGTGKTHLAAATMRRWIKGHSTRLDDSSLFLRKTGLFIPAAVMYDRLRSEMNDDSSGPVVMSQMLQADLLVLDDLGTEKQTDWTLERLNLLISSRYNDRLPTMFTMNHSLNWVAENVDQRIASRLAEGLVVNLEELPDWRVDSKRG